MARRVKYPSVPDWSVFEGVSYENADTGCRVWTGYCQSGGYGVVEIGGVRWLTHRLAWFLSHGEIPAGKLVLHRCDNPSCFNPEHLYIGNAKDNFRDAVARGRRSGRLPEWAVKKKRVRKFTDDEIRAVRSAEGTQQSISERFGISRSYVSEIRSGKRKSLVGPAEETT